MRSTLINVTRLGLFAFLLVAWTAGAVSADVTGRWSCGFIFNGTNYPQDLGLTQSGNSISGVEYTAGTNSIFATVVGTISGNSFSMTFDYNSSSYAASVTGTVNGGQMSGSWTSSSNQMGTFSCSRSSIVGPVPTPGSNSSKRPTGISMICNRSGDLLSATCGVTVGDAGAPPRKTPTGRVKVLSQSGAPAFSAECFVQQTPYSPGVAFCSVPYTPPAGFPIGVAFPVDALYEGDLIFEQSATSHELIMASCVGDSTNPCSGSVALEFADIPAIIKNKLKTIASCGGTNTARASLTAPANEGSGGTCEIDIELELLLTQMIQELTESEWRDLSEGITARDAQTDALLRAINQIGEKTSEELIQTIQNQLKLAEQLRKANQKYYNEQIKKNVNQAKTTLGDSQRATLRASSKPLALLMGKAKVTVKIGKQKAVSVKLDARTKRIIAAFKRGGILAAPVTVKAKYKRSGKKRTQKLPNANEQVNLF